jgi:hypothetical protein
MPTIISSNPVKVSINWTAIVQTLVADGFLPPEAMGDYDVNVLYSGPELLGNVNATLDVSGIRMTSTTPPIPGDANGDGHVNILDFNIVISYFGQTGAEVLGDVNSDGSVNILDFNMVISHFGQ